MKIIKLPLTLVIVISVFSEARNLQVSQRVQTVTYDFLWAQFNLKKLKDIEKYRITKNSFINSISLNYEYDEQKHCIKNTGYFKNDTTYKKYLDVINNSVYSSLVV